MSEKNINGLSFVYDWYAEKHQCCCSTQSKSRCKRDFYKMAKCGDLYFCWQHYPMWANGESNLVEEIQDEVAAGNLRIDFEQQEQQEQQEQRETPMESILKIISDLYDKLEQKEKENRQLRASLDVVKALVEKN